MSSDIQPGRTTPNQTDIQTLLCQIMQIDIGDLELCPWGRMQSPSNLARSDIVKIDARRRVLTGRRSRRLDDRLDPPLAVGPQYTITIGILYMIGKQGGALALAR